MIKRFWTGLKQKHQTVSDSTEDSLVPDREKEPEGGNNEAGRYICPYCGQIIAKEDVLFWEKVGTQYTDNVRGEFLRRHGVKISSGNKFPRLYYRVREGVVYREDVNGFPTMIEDHRGNAITPGDLEKESKPGGSGGFDDDFDSDDFGSGSESRGDRTDRTLHYIPQRACPKCHCELPLDFGTIETHYVAMIGSRAAGKTAYLVSLFQQLNQQLSTHRLGSVALEAESESFLAPMIREYESPGMIHPGQPQPVSLLPIVCRFKNQGKEAFIIFYDIAEEDATDPGYMAYHHGSAACETLMLMIDPNMFVGGIYATAWNANHGEGAEKYSATGDCCKDSLDSFLANAGNLCSDYSDNIKNIVCVITKLDMVLESDVKFFATGDIEVVKDIRDEHNGAVELKILKRVSDNLLHYLDKTFSVDLKEKLADRFGKDKRITILGVSTSTLVKRAPGSIRFEPGSSAVDRKHRIIEPFLAVMMYSGLVRIRKQNGQEAWINGKEETPCG